MTSQGVTGEGERPARRRRVEALPFTAEAKALDYARLLSHALRAIRCANVRSGILPPQSRLRVNDEPRRDGRRGSAPIAEGKWNLCSEINPLAAGEWKLCSESNPLAAGKWKLCSESNPLAAGEWKLCSESDPLAISECKPCF